MFKIITTTTRNGLSTIRFYPTIEAILSDVRYHADDVQLGKVIITIESTGRKDE